jgi:hypothetical protein
MGEKRKQKQAAKVEKKEKGWSGIKARQEKATDEAFDRHGRHPKPGETSGKGPRLGVRKKK